MLCSNDASADRASHPHAPQGELLSSLRPLHKLTHLRIVFHSESPEDTDKDTDADGGTSAPPAPVEDLARALHPSSFNFEGIATTVVQALPSLQALFLTTCGYFARCVQVGDGAATSRMPTSKRWNVSRAWRVAEPSAAVDGEPILEELQDEAAEAIIEREELVVPDECKVGVGLYLAEIVRRR